MDSSPVFSKVLRGYDPVVVDTRVRELEAEVQALSEQVGELQEANTTLRLNVVKQVEEASAEAAVVLGYARSEATRIRDAAVRESDIILADAEHQRDRLVAEATTATQEARDALESQRAERDEIIRRAQDNAEEIETKACETAEALEAKAKAATEESDSMIRERENDLRLRKLELDRIETEIREQADSYAMRVYREADEYRRTTERRSLDLEQQAQEFLDQAKKTSADITKNALEDARRNLANALDLVNTIFSDVSGSMVEVGRIRTLLGDSVERIRDQQLPAVSLDQINTPPGAPSLEEMATENRAGVTQAAKFDPLDDDESGDDEGDDSNADSDR